MDPSSQTSSPSGVQIERLGPGDEAVLQAVFEAAGDYFLTVTGRPQPDADAAEREIRDSAALQGREIALLRSESGDPVGALGWWQGKPEPDEALLGMLMVVPDARRQGLARAAFRQLEDRLAGDGVRRLRAGVGIGNGAAQAFLCAAGFRDLDDRRHVPLDAGRLMISLWEKEIAAR